MQNNPIWPVVGCFAGLAGLGALTAFRKLLTEEVDLLAKRSERGGIASLWLRG